MAIEVCVACSQNSTPWYWDEALQGHRCEECGPEKFPVVETRDGRTYVDGYEVQRTERPIENSVHDRYVDRPRPSEEETKVNLQWAQRRSSLLRSLSDEQFQKMCERTNARLEVLGHEIRVRVGRYRHCSRMRARGHRNSRRVIYYLAVDGRRYIGYLNIIPMAIVEAEARKILEKGDA